MDYNDLRAEEAFWRERFKDDSILDDDEMKRLCHSADNTNVSSWYRERMSLQCSLRAARDARTIVDAVAQFDKSSARLGHEMKGIARASLLLALVTTVFAAVAVLGTNWGEIWNALRLWAS